MNRPKILMVATTPEFQKAIVAFEKILGSDAVVILDDSPVNATDSSIQLTIPEDLIWDLDTRDHKDLSVDHTYIHHPKFRPFTDSDSRGRENQRVANRKRAKAARKSRKSNRK